MSQAEKIELWVEAYDAGRRDAADGTIVLVECPAIYRYGYIEGIVDHVIGTEGTWSRSSS